MRIPLLWTIYDYCLVVYVCRGTARRPRYKNSITTRLNFCSKFINTGLNAQYLPSYRLDRKSYMSFPLVPKSSAEGPRDATGILYNCEVEILQQMLKFKTSCAVLAYLSSNLLNEVGLSLFRYFKVGLRVCDIVVNKFTLLSHLLMSSCDTISACVTRTHGQTHRHAMMAITRVSLALHG